jgi:hypothetical protein
MLTPLVGGASDRRFHRLQLPSNAQLPLIVMIIPTVQSDIFDAFCANAAYLRSQGIPVPEIAGLWREQGIALLEDFGDTTMTAAVSAEPAKASSLYDAAIALLVRLHSCAESVDHPCPAFSQAFDEEKWDHEYHFHVRTWLVDRHWAVTPTRTEARTLDRAFSWLSRLLSRQPRVFTHRDYQSSNLLVSADGSLGLIDFQDARLGLRQYDLASLLYDSYSPLDDAERERLARLYASLSDESVPIEDHFQFVRLAAIQRKLHDAGAFAYTAYHRGKTDFLRYIPGAVTMATRLMGDYSELRTAGSILRDYAERMMRRVER